MKAKVFNYANTEITQQITNRLLSIVTSRN
nr:MAG TPA: hypothetical protein [Bacteriophage sp.]